MSGTSLDGIDLVYVRLSYNGSWQFQVVHKQTVSYTDDWTLKLQQAIQLDDLQLDVLNKAYTSYLAGVINSFIQEHTIVHITAVCTHGHTVYHEPAMGRTLQIGNLPVLAQLLQLRVVCDFRKEDVAMGGQGAPLVPVGDALLFANYSHCLNLGGFANISSTVHSKRVAFDICPVNVVLNRFARLLGAAYDCDGAFAKAGKINHKVVHDLNALSYYQQAAPKSLGMEWVNFYIWDLLKAEENPHDALATFVEHIAVQIARVTTNASQVLVTGGGAYNLFLMDRIRAYSKVHYVVPSPEIIEFKEAIIFGFLGVLRLRNQHNCLASVTGAPVDHCSGMIYVP